VARVLVLAARRNDLFREIRAIRGSDLKASAVQRFDDFPNFPRNLAPDFTHYMSERLEMTSSKQGVKEGRNKKRKLNHE